MASTVTVACKLPHGLILRLFDRVKFPEPQPGGGTKDVEMSQPRPQKVVLRGYLEKYDPGLAPAAKGSAYGFTHGVDADFMNEWLKQNSDLDAVVNGLILVHSKDTEGNAKERKDTKSGLEPIDPKKLKGRVETADEQKKFLGISVPA